MSQARTDFSAAAYLRDAQIAEAKAAEWQAAADAAVAGHPELVTYCQAEAKEWKRLSAGWRECAANA
ncbi:hypothetical protein BEN47_16775 [Hymenobacter lapidarius]|uniref:Uncharacterized protein n=1 Tax=Hymenobacter lapidarius TaxID=1908237 RepID=A0A1G1SZW1_9BACT|nr:hypothetical protein [Hymenobacter lapidarius]OGX84131.1 hypothetical protein BEN47_16775 [Hymenobacter lapidarius]